MTGIRAKIGACVLALALAAGTSGAYAEGEETHIERQKWTFGGVLGKFDDGQLQRGFKVYSEVCSRCHSLKRLQFRNLVQPGGPQFPEAAIKSLAGNNYQVDDVPDDQGKVNKRPATLAGFLSTPISQRASSPLRQNGALPPDLTLMAKARGSRGRYALLPRARHDDTRHLERLSGRGRRLHLLLPDRVRGSSGQHENGRVHELQQDVPRSSDGDAQPFLAGDGLVKYDDGTPATVDNYARDVVSFLSWAADPTLEERKRLGLLVMFYLVITAVLLGLAKRRIWREAH